MERLLGILSELSKNPISVASKARFVILKCNGGCYKNRKSNSSESICKCVIILYGFAILYLQGTYSCRYVTMPYSFATPYMPGSLRRAHKKTQSLSLKYKHGRLTSFRNLTAWPMWAKVSCHIRNKIILSSIYIYIYIYIYWQADKILNNYQTEMEKESYGKWEYIYKEHSQWFHCSEDISMRNDCSATIWLDPSCPCPLCV